MDKKFTIMFLSDRGGRHFTARVSLFIPAAFLFLSVCLVCITAVSVTGYVQTLRDNQNFRDMVIRLQSNVKQMELRDKKAAQYSLRAEDVLSKRFNFENISGQGNNVVAGKSLHGEAKGSGEPDGSLSLMAIDAFDIDRINRSLDFNCTFKLINRSQGRKKLSGYVFVVASNQESIPTTYESWPAAEITSGLPADYKKGSSFSIRYMKNVNGRINQPDIGPKYNRVDLLAFADNGDMLLNKAFYIDQLLQESPFEKP